MKLASILCRVIPVVLLCGACTGPSKQGRSSVSAAGPAAAPDPGSIIASAQHCFAFPDKKACMVQTIDRANTSHFFAAEPERTRLLADGKIAGITVDLESIS